MNAEVVRNTKGRKTYTNPYLYAKIMCQRAHNSAKHECMNVEDCLSQLEANTYAIFGSSQCSIQ